MQSLLFLDPQDDLQRLRDRLGVVFGKIRDGQRLDPTSQFVCAFLGSRTYDAISFHAFLRLIERYRSWDALADAPVSDLEAVLADVTYAEKKAPDLKRALRQIRARSGSINLEFLADLPVETGVFWLEQIYGVGRKIAAATLNFSTLRKRAFVVDTHVLRVLGRFGFVDAKATEVDAYEAIMAAAVGFEADDLCELHWYLKSLGQKTCRHARALCALCPLSDLCVKRVEKDAIVFARHPDTVA